MKTDLAITLIAVAILSLQPFTAAKSSSSNPQSVLDPLNIEEQTPKKPIKQKQQKYVKAPKRKVAQVSEKQQSSNLDETFDRETSSPKSLSLYQKATNWHKKAARTQSSTQIGMQQAGAASKKKSMLSWNSSNSPNRAPKARQNPQAKYKPNKPPHSIKNIHSKFTKNGSATSGPHKNIFQSSADATGKMFTAPFNKMRSLFGGKQSQ
jgi:hypothetical protein